MPGIHRLEHVQRFAAAHLADDDPVGTHPERSLHQRADRDLAFPLRVGVARLERDEVRNAGDLQFRRILDRDDPLVRRDAVGEGVQKRRLARPGAAADEHVVFRPDQPGQPVRRLLRQRAAGDEIVQRHRPLRKLADRHRRPVQRHRRQHHVHPRPVRKPGVDDRIRLVHRSVDAADDRPDQLFQPLAALERPRISRNAAVPFDEDVLVPVDHDFRDGRIVHERLQQVEAAEGVEQPSDRLVLVRGRKRLVPGPLEDDLFDDARQALVAQFLMQINPASDPLPQQQRLALPDHPASLLPAPSPRRRADPGTRP